MNHNKSLFIAKIIVCISLLICAANGLYNLTGSENEPLYFVISYAFVATSLFGAYYLLSGCKKDDSSTFYKLYMILFSVPQVLVLFGSNKVFDKISAAIAVALLLLLAFGKDMGKKKTLTIAVLLLVDMLAVFFTVFKQNLLDYSGLTLICLSFSTIIIILGKYEDKARRNSK